MGSGESTVDGCRKTVTVVDDLDETEWASNIDNTPERILAVGFAKLDIEPRCPQRLGRVAERAKIGVHAEVKVLREPYVAVCCQGDSPDDQHAHAS
ncbi:MAG: hypothetical protein WCR51_05470 [Planctomycetia bacterium]